MRSRPLQLMTEDGLTLEAIVDQPDEPAIACLLLCHPHPKMGGTMNAPLLTALRDEMVRRGWAVLRFNFRGIGASEGEAGLGIAEVADARAGLAAARQTTPDEPVAVAGWSFGGAVAVRLVAEEPGVAALVAIAPAVKEKPDVTAGLPSPDEIELRCPVHVIVGANDDLVSPQDARAWSEDVGANFHEMSGANHFFWGKYDDLTGQVVARLTEAVADTR